MNNTLTVEKLFSGRLLRVPDYQRGYAWDKKNWTDFLEDLDLLPRGKHHYTGTVVLDRVTKPPEGEAPEPSVWDQSGFGYEVFNIVDGQQRMTTVVLLLDAIRRELARDPAHKSLAQGTTAAYVRVPSAAGEWLHKLELNADSNKFWVNSVLADAPGPEPALNASQKRLAAAKAHFAAYLTQQREARGDAYTGWLLGLRTKITSNLVFVPYEVSTSAEVGVIFEVMNDRGKQLTELEKAKNYLLYLSSKLDLPPHSLADTVNTTWAEVFGRLMAAGLSESRFEDQLLRAHWLMAYDPDRRSWDGTASVKRLLGLRGYDGRHPVLLADALAYVRSLGSASLAYSEILSPFGSFGPPLTSSEPERLRIERTSRRLLRVGAIATFLAPPHGDPTPAPDRRGALRGDGRAVRGVRLPCLPAARQVRQLGPVELLPTGARGLRREARPGVRRAAVARAHCLVQPQQRVRGRPLRDARAPLVSVGRAQVRALRVGGAARRR